jgi:hypothetical protein
MIGVGECIVVSSIDALANEQCDEVEVVAIAIAVPINITEKRRFEGHRWAARWGIEGVQRNVDLFVH